MEARKGCCFVARHREKQQSNKQQTSTRAQEAVCAIVALSQNNMGWECVISVINQLAMTHMACDIAEYPHKWGLCIWWGCCTFAT